MRFNVVFGVIYFASSCMAQGAGQDDSRDDDYQTEPPPGLLAPTVFEPPVPSLQLQSTWPNVFASERVVFICIINSSDWTFTWYKNDEQLQEPELDMKFGAGGSSLTITAAASSHSGNYSCKGHHKTQGGTVNSNSLWLRVSPNKPKPVVVSLLNSDVVFPGESIVFTCVLKTLSGWDYLWYHNGKKIQESKNNTYRVASVTPSDGGEYHCNAKRGERPFYTEESERANLHVSDPPAPSLKLRSSWYGVFQNETVELSCDTGGPDWSLTWYRNGQPIHEDSGLTLSEGGAFLTVSASQTNQGSFACKARHKTRGVSSGFSNKVDVTYYGNTPKPSLSKNPAFDTMYVGETVIFTCKASVGIGWKYQWYKDSRPLKASNETLKINLGLSDRGVYFCKATRGKSTSTDSSNPMTQHVDALPVPTLNLINNWHDIFPSESMRMSCEIPAQVSGWTFAWFKDEKKLQANQRLVVTPSGSSLSIPSASVTDAGRYHCLGYLQDRSVNSNRSNSVTLKVHGKQPSTTLTQDPKYEVMFAGEVVSLTCHVNVSSGWEYVWYKNGHQLPDSSNKRTIKLIGKQDSGSYSCKAKRGMEKEFSTGPKNIYLDVQEKKPTPLITLRPNTDRIYMGESVTFDCKVEISSGWKYRWYKDSRQLPVNGTRLTIKAALFSDNGTYSCVAKRENSMFETMPREQSLHVIDIPVPTLKQKTKWLDVFPTERVIFVCEMVKASDWTYSWYRDNHTVTRDHVVSFESDGRFMSIGSAAALHAGKYSCSGKLKGRSVNTIRSPELTLEVYDKKPSAILKQVPEQKLFHTEDHVIFLCNIAVSSGWEFLWYKDGKAVSGTPYSVSGKHLEIIGAETKDTGSYECQGRRTSFKTESSPPMRLTVKERPSASIILLTGWTEVFSTETLVLKCNVEENLGMWNYTWYKENQITNSTQTEKYTVTPQNDPEQSQYSCRGVRQGTPSYSKQSEHFKTKNLLLKRRVLLSISGCLFFGIIAVFLGCIALRIFRKPGDGEEKPEEPELFLTMAQLKSSGDASCPLVNYITDASLNEPEKEEDVKKADETLPLLVTPEEDTAVKMEGLDKSDDNVGLASFKQ